jgi:hypothetical protein
MVLRPLFCRPDSPPIVKPMTRLSSDACHCSAKLSVKDSLRELASESVELLKEPSRDELSDVCYAVGRLLGALSGKSYVKVPGDKLHIDKVNARLLEYGCVRSKRHLVAGVCPTKDLSTTAN